MRDVPQESAVPSRLFVERVMNSRTRVELHDVELSGAAAELNPPKSVSAMSAISERKKIRLRSSRIFLKL
jgi:hypothetical protein